MSRPLRGKTCACFESRLCRDFVEASKCSICKMLQQNHRESKHVLNMLPDGYDTYSKARAVPRAMRTRAFQGKALLLSSAKWSMSCKFPFPIYS